MVMAMDILSCCHLIAQRKGFGFSIQNSSRYIFKIPVKQALAFCG
jgi:hypothetical protein